MIYINILRSKPHNPHYLNRYIKFIGYCSSNNKQLDEFTEDHHVCPKSSDLFPEFKSFKKFPWNKVSLTLRQHYIAHRILWKAYGGRQAQAFKLMCDRLSFNKSRCYEEIRNEHIKYMTEHNPNANGVQGKKAWESAHDRRRRQAEVMRQVNETKKKPKETRSYKCTYCGDELFREEFCHHSPKEHYYCNPKCRNTYIAKFREKPVGNRKTKADGRVAWNKGLSGTGFGDPKTNPMNNPDSIKKMIETRKINREKKRGL